MRKYLLFYILLLFSASALSAQNLTFGLTNKVTTSTDVTFDVTLLSDTDFKLGSGQLYFNFNTDAFGEWVEDNNRVTISYPSGCVLSQQVLATFDIYNTFVINDNTASRFSFSWQQAFSSGSIPANNITATPVVLFQVTIEFDTGGAGEPDNICFESGSAFDDQTFTACGPTSLAAADCLNFPGTQLTNDNFDCSALLPIELVDFSVRAGDNYTSQLSWQTSNEINNDFFTIERSFDGRNFTPILEVDGAGNSQQLLYYEALDPNPQMGVNYYRLKQTDFDGKYDYSEIRSVLFEAKGSEIGVSVFPNPATQFLNIQFDQSVDQSQIQLFNVAGQLIQEQQLPPNAMQAQLQLDQLPEGMYWISILADGQVFSEKVVIARE